MRQDPMHVCAQATAMASRQLGNLEYVHDCKGLYMNTSCVDVVREALAVTGEVCAHTHEQHPLPSPPSNPCPRPCPPSQR